MAERTCSLEGCEQRHYSKGWCRMHYNRWRRTGDPGEAAPRVQHLEFPASLIMRLRFMPNGCVEFTGALGTNGRGSVRVAGRPTLPYVAAYELLVGPVPDGMELDHLCRNPPCVNPAHLEPVTHKVNMERGAWATKTHCPQGHPYDETNTYRTKAGGRACRACHRASEARRSAARRS